VTTEYGTGEEQITETLEAVLQSTFPAIVLWPNADAGSDDIARGIRKWRERGFDNNMHFFKNLPIHVYIRLMRKTSCLVGNSSSGIREGAFIGTPCINIGTRQTARERGTNVIDINGGTVEILNALREQIAHGPYQSEPVYGDGMAGEKIANILASKTVNVQKLITY
jgi:UDP-N-acetylglucosamine 2-epimerase